jgi:Protein of unknown function (DUF3300)
MHHFRRRVLAATLPFLLTAAPVFAQQPVPPTREEATAALNPAPAAFTPPQLDQMLAPIALYPDKLLTTLLMAATFPAQIVDAGKWLQDPANATLKGDDLVAALQPLPWDPSVKSLVPFPQIVAMLNDHLDWTEALGTAFANQQIEMMARIQFLRQRAVAAGQLKSTAQLAVAGGSDSDDITIEPVDPDRVYMPVYNPAEAYGDWPDRDYPPVYIPPPPDYGGGSIGPGIGVAVGFGVVGALWGWGHPDWRHHEVVIDRSRYTSITNEAAITNNHIVIQNDIWHRTAPVAALPAMERPHPAAVSGPPSGTVAPSAVAHPGGGHEHGAPQGAPPQPAEIRPAGGPPHPAEAHPSEPHPAEAHPPGPPAEARPPEAPSHPAEAHPPEAPARPAEAHPSEAPHPAEAHPGPPPAAAHPPAPPPHPPGPPPAAARPPGPPPGHPPGKPEDRKPGEQRPGEQEPPPR